jgi:SAM-dependent methyltransferase
MTDPGQSGRAHEYELGHSDRELKRLRLQARLVDPITRQFLHDAGLESGMRVLDVGSGGGDTALLAAEVVGDGGEVVGVDTSPVAVAAAQDRTRALGKRNISFRQGDPAATKIDGKFDAVVGRYVLMFNPDPAAMLRSLARRLRPGGVIVFHETDWNGVRSAPLVPMYDQCHDWIVRTFKKLGTNPYMGHDLHSAFVRAGIPAPSMGLRALIESPSSDVAYFDMIAELAITMAPVMEEQGVIARGAIDPASFGQRMRGEAERLDSVMVGRSEIGAWSRVL